MIGPHTRINFLIPLEIEQTILLVGPNIQDVSNKLIKDGYSMKEVKRCFRNAINQKIILYDDKNNLYLRPDRKDFVRRYCLLDLIAIHGSILDSSNIKGKILIPGYGPFYGISEKELAEIAIRDYLNIRKDWENIQVAFNDIQWLKDSGYVMST